MTRISPIDAVVPPRSAAPSIARLGPLRFAARELRGGLRGFYIFIACIALGVMAIAGVGLAMWLFPVWAAWIERNRALR